MKKKTFYHYTSIDAFNSILQNEADEKHKICFRATRFDCFKDKKEYIGPIDKYGKILKLLEKKNEVQNIGISQFITKKNIEGNTFFPLPYIVSFTDSADNQFMWENYGCKGEGIVMEFELPHNYHTTINHCEPIAFKPCSYKINEGFVIKNNIEQTDYLNKLIKQNKNQNISDLCLSNPNMKANLIAILLILHVIPTIKEVEYCEERENRLILGIPPKEYLSKLNKYCQEKGIKIQDLFFKTGILITDFLKSLYDEHCCNNKWYREVFLPQDYLKCVYIKNIEIKKDVLNILQNKSLDIPIKIIK